MCPHCNEFEKRPCIKMSNTINRWIAHSPNLEDSGKCVDLVASSHPRGDKRQAGAACFIAAFVGFMMKLRVSFQHRSRQGSTQSESNNPVINHCFNIFGTLFGGSMLLTIVRSREPSLAFPNLVVNNIIP